MNIVHISWDSIEDACKKLAKLVRDWKLAFIYGVPRGGLIPAVILSHKLGIPVIDQEGFECSDRDNILIVDDIWETGETMNRYRHHANARRAVLYGKHVAAMPNNIICINPMAPDWLVFPWEDATKAVQDYSDYIGRRPGLAKA